MLKETGTRKRPGGRFSAFPLNNKILKKRLNYFFAFVKKKKINIEERRGKEGCKKV